LIDLIKMFDRHTSKPTIECITKKVLTAVKNCASQSDTTATNELTAQITAIQQVVTILASIKTSLSSDIRQNII